MSSSSSSPPNLRDRESISPNPKRAPPCPTSSPPRSRSRSKSSTSPPRNRRSRSSSRDGGKRRRSRSSSRDGGGKRRRRQSLTVAVCRDFLRRACPRDVANCKFAHPPPSVTIEQDKVTVCGDSRRNKCFRGDSCRYFHPPPHIQETLSRETRLELERERPNTVSNNHQAVCQDFVRGRCDRKSCRFSHALARDIPHERVHPYRAPIFRPPSPPRHSYNEETVQVCKDFLNGKCNRGSCKYFHPNLQPMAYGPTHYERPERRTYSPPRTAYEEETVQVCNDFLKGICRRDSCRFLHPRLETVGLANTVYGTLYNNAAVNRLASPPRTTHTDSALNRLASPPRTTRTDYGEEKTLICRDFMKGLCNRNICKFSHHKIEQFSHHNIEEPSHHKIEQFSHHNIEEPSHHKIEHAIVDYGPILELSRSPPRHSYERETGDVCRDFMKGLCNRASCKFVHSIPERDFYEQPYCEAPLPPRSPPRTAQGDGVCRDFLKGICDRASCKFIHSISEPNVFGRSYNTAPIRPRSPPPSRISHDDEELMVCRDFLNNMCNRNSCKFTHPSPATKVVDGKVEICRDFRRGTCRRPFCHFYHPNTKR